MPDRMLNVFMDGTRMGHVTMTEGGPLAFDYDSEYLELPGATPLSLSMPLPSLSGRSHYGNKQVRPFLQGLLPDNPLALESLARKYQVSVNSPFAMLEQVGRDVAGALQLLPPGVPSDDALADRTAVEPLDDQQLAARLRETLDVYDNGAVPRETQRMSLAGAQPKLGLARTADGRWALPQPGVPTTHIFKPQRADEGAFPDSDIVEYFCQQVVAGAGVPAASSELWNSPDGSIRAVVSERYDRQRQPDGTYRRLHQEDLCQAMSVEPSKKYQREDGGPGIAQIGRLFVTKLPLESAHSVVAAFLRALTCNAALLNSDAHAKNYSLMLSGDSVRLAPMYDVLSIGAFLADGERPQFPMRIGGKYDLEQVFPETLAKEGARLGLPQGEGEQIVETTLAALGSSLDATAERLSAFDRNGIITRTVEAVNRHSALLRSLGK